MNPTRSPSAVAPATRLGRGAQYLLSQCGCHTAGDAVAYSVFVVGFVATLAYFNFVDVYDNYFFRSDHSAGYNVLRVVFMAYLFWLVSFVGQKALVSAAGMESLASIKLHERLALGFFVGGAVLTIVMLVLGYLN